MNKMTKEKELKRPVKVPFVKMTSLLYHIK